MSAGLVGPASAAIQEVVHLPEESYLEPGFAHCDGFDVDLSGSQTETFIVLRDEGGQVVKVFHHGQVVETFTNTVSGETLTNRGNFIDMFTRVDGTEDFTHAVVGFDFIAPSPGMGLVLQQVGRKVFSLDGEEIVFSAGQTNVVEGPAFEDQLCAALA